LSKSKSFQVVWQRENNVAPPKNVEFNTVIKGVLSFNEGETSGPIFPYQRTASKDRVTLGASNNAANIVAPVAPNLRPGLTESFKITVDPQFDMNGSSAELAPHTGGLYYFGGARSKSRNLSDIGMDLFIASNILKSNDRLNFDRSNSILKEGSLEATFTLSINNESEANLSAVIGQLNRVLGGTKTLTFTAGTATHGVIRLADGKGSGDIGSFSADISYRLEAFEQSGRIGIRAVDVVLQTRTGDNANNGDLNRAAYDKFKNNVANRLRDRLTMSLSITSIANSNVKAPLGFPNDSSVTSLVTTYTNSPVITRPILNDAWRITLKNTAQAADVPVNLSDINLDGINDVGHGSSDSFRVYTTLSNYGDLSKASFTVTGKSSVPMTGTTGDFNADGKVDLAVSRKPDDKGDGRVRGTSTLVAMSIPMA